jgi:glutathione synthase/RimK-type ligase-like ATP-grasp enzyme
MRIALVSCLDLPEPDIDEAPLLDALRAAGHDARSAPWEDDAVDWSGFDAAIVRATWNYAHHPERFTHWIDTTSTQTTLLNPAPILRANLHKSYLLDLASKSVPIIPSVFLDKGSTPDIRAIADEHHWSRVVIKPSISAGSYATRAFDIPGESVDAQHFLIAMLTQRDMMVQPFMTSVARGGEVCMIHIDNTFTHAIQKQPRFDGDDESVSRSGALTPDHHNLARRIIDAAAASHALYARVDLIEDDDGALMLSELELLEPSLFFPYDDNAATKMVRAIEKRLRVPQP